MPNTLYLAYHSRLEALNPERPPHNLQWMVGFHANTSLPGETGDDLRLGTNCSQATIGMMLGYLDPQTRYSYQDIMDISGRRGAWTFPTHYITHFIKQGLAEVTQYTRFDWERFASEGFGVYQNGDAQQKNQAGDEEYEKQGARDFLNAIGKNLIHEEPTVEHIVSAVGRGCLVRVGVDANYITPDLDVPFAPHSVLAMGYTHLDANVGDIVCHDPGYPDRDKRIIRKVQLLQGMQNFIPENGGMGMIDVIRPLKDHNRLGRVR